MTENNPYKSVFIIESEGASDLLVRRTEGEGLERLLSLCNFESTLRKITSVEQFRQEILIFSRSQCGVLHLSCHGNENGIEFTNGDSMPWAQVFSQLEPYIGNRILLLSSCSPMCNTKLVELFSTSTVPPFMVAGSRENLLWREAFVVWTLVYNALSCETPSDATQRALAAFHLVSNRDFCIAFWTPNKEEGMGHFVWDAKQSLNSVIRNRNKLETEQMDGDSSGDAIREHGHDKPDGLCIPNDTDSQPDHASDSDVSDLGVGRSSSGVDNSGSGRRSAVANRDEASENGHSGCVSSNGNQ